VLSADAIEKHSSKEPIPLPESELYTPDPSEDKRERDTQPHGAARARSPQRSQPRTVGQPVLREVSETFLDDLNDAVDAGR
jgi:hypothetical protein